MGGPDIPVWAAGLTFAIFELPHFIMQRKMMLGIKERAERAHGTVAVSQNPERRLAEGASARTLDRLERRPVQQTVRSEHARVAKQAAPTGEVEWLADEIGHTSTGFL